MSALVAGNDLLKRADNPHGTSDCSPAALIYHVRVPARRNFCCLCFSLSSYISLVFTITMVTSFARSPQSEILVPVMALCKMT